MKVYKNYGLLLNHISDSKAGKGPEYVVTVLNDITSSHCLSIPEDEQCTVDKPL